MKGSIVHHEHRVGLWPSSTMSKELLNEVLEDTAVSRSLVHVRKQYVILCVGRQDLVSTITMESGYLDMCDV